MLRDWLLTPIVNPRTQKEETYNFRQSSTRTYGEPFSHLILIYWYQKLICYIKKWLGKPNDALWIYNFITLDRANSFYFHDNLKYKFYPNTIFPIKDIAKV